MCVELFDLRLEPLAMRPVFSRVDRLSFQRQVLGPKSVDLTPKPLVLDFDVFAFAHQLIVAR